MDIQNEFYEQKHRAYLISVLNNPTSKNNINTTIIEEIPLVKKETFCIKK